MAVPLLAALLFAGCGSARKRDPELDRI